MRLIGGSKTFPSHNCDPSMPQNKMSTLQNNIQYFVKPNMKQPETKFLLKTETISDFLTFSSDADLKSKGQTQNSTLKTEHQALQVNQSRG